MDNLIDMPLADFLAEVVTSFNTYYVQHYIHGQSLYFCFYFFVTFVHTLLQIRRSTIKQTITQMFEC